MARRKQRATDPFSFRELRDEFICRLGDYGLSGQAIADVVNETIQTGVKRSLVYSILSRNGVSLRAYRRGETPTAKEVVKRIDKEVYGRRHKRWTG